jgi:anti-anti-sigma factor
MAIAEDVQPRDIRAPAVPGVTVDRVDGSTVIRLEGEFDIASRLALSESFAYAMTLDNGDLVVDLSAVEFMGAETVDLILRGRAFLLARSRNLTMRSPSSSAQRVLDLCGVVDAAA